MALTNQYDYCIVGLGPAGLTLAYNLLRAGKTVIAVERDNRAGGLAKSYNIDGNIFDTGPKRFHSDDARVINFLLEIAEKDLMSIGRSTKVYFANRFLEWPLAGKSLFKLPKMIGLKCFIDLALKPDMKDITSFREYIISRYGKTLYETFFEPYTSKFLRWNPNDLHSDWASTGINRAVVDKRIKANALADLCRAVLLPQKVDTEFLYPTTGGFGGFFDKLYTLCNSYDEMECIFNTKINAINRLDRGFSLRTTDNQEFTADQLVWSGNVNDLHRLITKKPARMNFLNTVFYNIVCRADGVGKNRAQWIYVSSGNTMVSRITCMKDFADYTCKEGYYNFICEVTDSQANPLYFNSPERNTDQVIDELCKMGFIKNRLAIERVSCNSIRDTYPIYCKSYMRDFAEVQKDIKDFSDQIHLLGRLGAFWYNNSDHSIRMALELAEKLINNADHSFDYRDYFGGIVTSKGLYSCC